MRTFSVRSIPPGRFKHSQLPSFYVCAIIATFIGVEMKEKKLKQVLNFSDTEALFAVL